MLLVLLSFCPEYTPRKFASRESLSKCGRELFASNYPNSKIHFVVNSFVVVARIHNYD